MVLITPLIKKNEKSVDCFLKTKKDYLKFLDKEKIFYKSAADKIVSLKRVYIPMSFWIDDKYKKRGKTITARISIVNT